MTDLATDHSSAVGLVIGEYRRLQKHDPKHKLLKYLSEVWDVGIAYSSDETIASEFTREYGLDSALAPTGLANYYIDLRKAVDEIEGIDRSPKPNKSISIEDEGALDIEDEPPF